VTQRSALEAHCQALGGCRKCGHAAGVFPIVDTTTGYAVRANRPHSTGQEAQGPHCITGAGKH